MTTPQWKSEKRLACYETRMGGKSPTLTRTFGHRSRPPTRSSDRFCWKRTTLQTIPSHFILSQVLLFLFNAQKKNRTKYAIQQVLLSNITTCIHYWLQLQLHSIYKTTGPPKLCIYNYSSKLWHKCVPELHSHMYFIAICLSQIEKTGSR